MISFQQDWFASGCQALSISLATTSKTCFGAMSDENLPLIVIGISPNMNTFEKQDLLSWPIWTAC